HSCSRPTPLVTLHAALPIFLTISSVHFVYILRCADGTLYTGYARSPEGRCAVHNSGKGAKYTRSRLPVLLVYQQECRSLSEALRDRKSTRLNSSHVKSSYDV